VHHCTLKQALGSALPLYIIVESLGSGR